MTATLLKSCMCPCSETAKCPPRQIRGTRLKCGIKDLQEGSGKADSLKKWREKKSFKEGVYRKTGQQARAEQLEQGGGDAT